MNIKTYKKIAKMVADSNKNDGNVPIETALEIIEEAAASQAVTSDEFRQKAKFVAIFHKNDY